LIKLIKRVVDWFNGMIGYNLINLIQPNQPATH